MGNARWSQADFAQHSRSVATQSQQQIFPSHALAEELDPAKIDFRESVDSENNPNSTPIIIAADETGSMGVLAEVIIKTGLGVIMESIYKHKPVPDPHICCMGIGDAHCDAAPLQVTQFEASVDPLVAQVAKIFIEGNGGGNQGESYSLAWWMATYKVKSDAWTKRGRKGYLFTIGDEAPHPCITVDQVRGFLGVPCERDVPTEELLKIVQEHWHVYHLIVKPVGWQPVINKWRELLGERAINVGDRHEKLAEIIVSLITLNEGADVNAVKSDFDEDTIAVIDSAVVALLPVGAGAPA